MSGVALTLIALAVIYSLIIGAILVFRGAVYKLAGARWAYSLWFVLFIPVVALLLGLSGIRLVPDELGMYALLELPLSSDAETNYAGPVFVIWILGLAWSMCRSGRAFLGNSRAIRAGCQPVSADQERQVARFCAQVGVFPCPTVRFLPGASGPAILGIVDPFVLLPTRFFEDFTAAERALMMRHELAHLQRRDPYWNLLLRVLRCVFWFNPLVYLAERRFRVDQERSCD